MIFKMCNNRELTEEIMQERYILAFKRLAQLKHKSLFYNWLKSIIMNTLYTAKRESSFDNINSIVDINECNNILFETLQRLPENQRVCII